MVKPYKQTLTASSEQGTYVGIAKEDKIKIPRDYLLQRIYLDIRGTMDITVGVSALVEDAGQRLLSEIRIEMTGGKTGAKTAVNVSGVDLYFLNFYDYAEGLERVVPTAIANGVAVSMQFCLDFRLAKNDPDDYSIAIPLYDKSEVTLALKWIAAATGYGTNTSNWSLTAKVTLFQGIPENAKEFEAARTNPLMTLVSSEFNMAAGAAQKEKRNTDIGVGDLLRRLFIIARTSANLRSDVEFDWLSLKYNLNDKVEILLDEVDWDALGLEDESDYSLINYDGNRAIKGLIVLDFARGAFDEKGRVFGLDTTQMKSGDMKLEIYRNNASSIIRYIAENIEIVK